MKFGKNLAHLSIPEWKDYNLDYNELKKHIRIVTQDTGQDLRGLRRLFLENFDHVDLFILTKSGELTRKLKTDAAEFARLKASNEPVIKKLENLDSLHYRCINEVSIELRKLNKFILVQKLAVKKIFKKLAKHYPDPESSSQFITSLNRTLHTNRASFTNFDSQGLTEKLSDLLSDLDQESKLLHDSLHKKSHLSRPAQLSKNHSTTSIGSLKTSVFSNHSAPDDVNLDANIDSDIASTARFDLITALKKNFSLHGLLPRDVASRNDISLSMDVYLSIPKVAETSRVSITYLTESANDDSPSWIVSYENSPVSAVIAYTGGLRKYSYCCLPNTVVNSILIYLDQGTSPAQRARVEANISTYLQDESLSYMTKLAVAYLVQSETTPSLRIVMDRTRYFLHKGGRRDQAPPKNPQSELSISPISADFQSTAPSLDETRVFEDSFYMTLDEHIYTSSHVQSNVSFDISQMDPFPFNTFSINSNDSTLHTFEDSLSTEIHGNVLQNKFRAITLKKLPIKIQNFLRMTSVQLFKDLSLFDYMRSCYYNVIPVKQNNHYSLLLNINLFKSYENIEAINSQHDVDGSIIQDKSRIILNRQMSYKSLKDAEAVSNPNSHDSKNITLPNEEHSNPFYTPYTALKGGSLSYHLTKLTDLEQYDEDGNEDSYIAYLSLTNDLENNLLNNIVLSFIRFKYRTKKVLGITSNRDSVTVYREHSPSHPDKHTQEYFYDSINEDATFLDKTNDYQIKLVRDYDYVLSLLYFSLCFSSIFISGINIGILFSLFDLVGDGARFNVLDNFMVIILLIFGFLFSLAFTMISINLNFQRFESSPVSHTSIIWTGFLLVILTIIWSVLCIIP